MVVEWRWSGFRFFFFLNVVFAMFFGMLGACLKADLKTFMRSFKFI